MTLTITDALCNGCAHRIGYTNWCGMLMVACSNWGGARALVTPMLDCGGFQEAAE